FVFVTAPPPTATYTLSLHDALPIFLGLLFFVRGTPTRGPAILRDRLAALDRERVGGHVPGDDRAGRDVGAGAHRQRRDQAGIGRSEEHTSELQSRSDLVCRLLLEKK